MAGAHYSHADLPPTLPLFPLAGALLMPRAWLPLHIFEPRYIALFDAAVATKGRLVGMIQPDADGLAAVGCAGRITSFSETAEGTYSVTLTGISRFKLAGPPEPSGPFLTAPVDWRGFEADLQPSEVSGFDRGAFLSWLEKYGAAHGRALDRVAHQRLGALDDEELINQVAMSAGFSDRDKQALLEAPTLGERGALLISLMQFAIRGDVAEDRMQ